MRKLLLATVAALGASMGVSAVADAQTATPAPGTVTVRLNGRFRFYAFGVNDNVNNNSAGTATGTVGANGQGTAGGTNKQQGFGFANYARLYPGFDGVAANGLKYGASLEIRQDNNTAAGGGAFGSISQQGRTRAGLYLRREWGYLGTDQLGTVRLGSADGPSGLMMVGNFENFDAGGLNGDIPAFVSGNAQIAWPFADVGAIYTTTKAVYLSPQLYGFDLGVGFEPSTAALTGGGSNGCGTNSYGGANFVTVAGTFAPAAGSNSTGASSPGCDRLIASPSVAESQRRRNTVDAVLRYRGTFSGFGVAVMGGYVASSHVAYNGQVPQNAVNRVGYNGLSLGETGLQLSYAGFAIGGMYQYGNFNGGSWNIAPRGLPKGQSFLLGASYTNGPVVVGAHYLNSQTAGDAISAFLGRQRFEWGVAAGGTYTVAPGLAFYLSYNYVFRRQNGFNFVTGQNTGTVTGAGNAYNNSINSQIFALGTSFSW